MSPGKAVAAGPRGTSLGGGLPSRLRGLPRRWMLVLPAVAWYCIFYLAPLAFPLYFSLGRSQGYGGLNIGGMPTLANYARAWDPIYRDTFMRTFRLALLGTLSLVVIGFPIAYFLARRAGRWKFVLLWLTILPFWASFLVRTYSWIILLSPNGPASDFLTSMHLRGSPLNLLFTPTAVWMGILYNYLPLMILALFGSLERLDPSLLEASKDLGNGPVRTFGKITLPLVLPGVVTATVLVFIPLTGEYIIPELLGGAKSAFVGNVIVNQFRQAQDWPFGSALGITLGLLVLLSIGAYALALSRPLRRVT